MSNALGAGLNDGWTVGAATRVAVVALVEVFIRASEAGPATFTRHSVSHTVVSTWTKCADPPPAGIVGGLRLGEPERDFAPCRLRRIGAVHQVELRFEAEVAPDGAGRGLLTRVRRAGELPHRRDRPRALHDRRHQRPRRDELQQGPEKRLAIMLGVVTAGQLLANDPHFQRCDGQAFALDAADDLAHQASLDPVGLDQQESPLGHLRRSFSSQCPPQAAGGTSLWGRAPTTSSSARVTAHSVPNQPGTPTAADQSGGPSWPGSSPRLSRRRTSDRT